MGWGGVGVGEQFHREGFLPERTKMFQSNKNCREKLWKDAKKRKDEFGLPQAGGPETHRNRV